MSEKVSQSLDTVLSDSQVRFDLVGKTTTSQTEWQRTVNVAGAVAKMRPSAVLTRLDGIMGENGGMLTVEEGASEELKAAAELGFLQKKALVRENNKVNGRPVALGILLTKESGSGQVVLVNENGAWVQVGQAGGEPIKVVKSWLTEQLGAELGWRVSESNRLAEEAQRLGDAPQRDAALKEMLQET